MIRARIKHSTQRQSLSKDLRLSNRHTDFELNPSNTTLDRLGTILHTSINLAEETSRRRVTSDQQWPRPHFSECITSPFARSIPLIMKYLIQPWFECFRADLATNAHCSLAVALLFSMPRGVFRPPCGYFSFRSELRRRDSRDSMT
jgi:hypothetical protein